MAVSELKTFDLTCDRCKARKRHRALYEFDRPAGWVKETEFCSDHYCHGHDVDLCPKCARSEKKQSAEHE